MTDKRYKKNIALFYVTVMKEIDEILSPDYKVTFTLQPDVLNPSDSSLREEMLDKTLNSKIEFLSLREEMIEKIINSKSEIEIECAGIYEKQMNPDELSITLKFNKENQTFTIVYKVFSGAKYISFEDDIMNGTSKVNHWVCKKSSLEYENNVKDINQIHSLNRKVNAAIRLLVDLPE